jgi:hypothetical protein
MTNGRQLPLLERCSEPRRVAAVGRRVVLWLANRDAYAVACVEAE